MPELVPLQGSERAEIPGAQPSGDVDQDAVIAVTLMLRRRARVPAALIEGPQTLTSEQLGAQYGADPADVALATEVLGRYGLTVSESHAASRRVKVRGTIAELSTAFGTTLTMVTSPHPDGSGPVTHRYRSG
ncbi:MAG TPA: protease pro-enzyme activation domain-containing protein, partial [Streptosporangiaceae bacterium]|nr:protease pro-enzyme activation domain-containing protein [Streptosporangiaceae bacterium]